MVTPLTAASAQALVRLRTYVPPPTQYYNLPLTRRAAVLILLYPDRWGDLRVVLTMRSSSLRSFSGHAAFPGGKADALNETPYHTARREAWEEIGLPLSDAKLPIPFTVEPICQFPTYLTSTQLAVRPCIAFLSASPERWKARTPPTSTNTDTNTNTSTSTSTSTKPPSNTISTVEEILIPRPSAQEVAAVFTAPFQSFLRETDLNNANNNNYDPTDAATFSQIWHDMHFPPPPSPSTQQRPRLKLRMHEFQVPVSEKTAVRPPRRKRAPVVPDGTTTTTTARSGPVEEKDDGIQEEEEVDPLAGLSTYRVWGFTARMLVDVSRMAYAERSGGGGSGGIGDEVLVERMIEAGRMGEKKVGDKSQDLAEPAAATAAAGVVVAGKKASKM